MRTISAFCRAKRSAWTRSSASCWKWRSKRSTMRACRTSSCAVLAPAFTSRATTTTTHSFNTTTSKPSTLRTLTGTLHSVLANRLSYFLDLRSPSISIDTACSSSLVAIHLACQSLRFGETDLAIAGGVSLMITPELMVSMSKVGFMAPDGRCKTFDAQADGFGRGEGCGVVVLKRLVRRHRRQRQNSGGDPRFGRQPGRTLNAACGAKRSGPGGTDPRGACHARRWSPIGLASSRRMEPARRSATRSRSRRSPRPSASRRPESAPCLLGSVKANLGHLEAAAGVIGLIKAVLALRHEAVPPQVNFSKLNPHISLAGTRLSIPTSLTPWPAGPLAAMCSDQLVRRRRNQCQRDRRGSPEAGRGFSRRTRGCLLTSCRCRRKVPRRCRRWRSLGSDFLPRRPPRSPICATPPRCGARTTTTGLRWSGGQRKS